MQPRFVFRGVGLFFAGALVLIVASTTQAQVCAADCDTSGNVTVDELVAATAVGLERMEISDCGNADANQDGTVAVDELVAGVANLLGGCPLPPAEAAPAAALAAARLAEHIHALSRAVAVAFDGSDRTEQCVFGGTLENTCEDPGTGFVRVDVDARACRVESLEGDVTYQGPAVLTGQGNCQLVLPLDLRFDFDWTGVTEHEDGTPHLELRWEGSALLESFTLGPPPCVVKGATAVLDGRIEFDTLDGWERAASMRAVSRLVCRQGRSPSASEPEERWTSTATGTGRSRSLFVVRRAASGALRNVLGVEGQGAYRPPV